VVPTASQPADEDEAAEEEEQAEEEEAAEEDAETDATAADAMAFRSVPSHFYPEAKAKSAAWCGTHKRFEEGDNEEEPAPVSEEMKEAIDELGEVSRAAACAPLPPLASAAAALLLSHPSSIPQHPQSSLAGQNRSRSIRTPANTLHPRCRRAAPRVAQRRA
jgi:hypothetical protein